MDPNKRPANSSETVQSVSATSSDQLTPRRGPGRPRLKLTGPAHQGHRAIIRTRKLPGPLVVPLGSNPSSSLASARSPIMVSSTSSPADRTAVAAANIPKLSDLQSEPTYNEDI